MRRDVTFLVAMLLGGWICSQARGTGQDLIVQAPAGITIKSAKASNTMLKFETDGAIRQQSVTFTNLLPETPYDVQLTLADGRVLLGVDMNWYNEETLKPGTKDLDDDDREQVRALVVDIKDFYNKKKVVLLNGNHARATGLVELKRDTEFYAGKGQVIWRIELWYFKNQHGGWEIVSQQNKILRRERLKGPDALTAIVEPLRLVPELGGIRLPKDKQSVTMTLTPAAAEGIKVPAK